MLSKSRSAGTAGAFELKGRMLTLSVLRVLAADLQLFAAELDEKIAQAPDFFRGLPVLLDLEAVEQALPDVGELVGLLRARGLQPVGTRALGEAANASFAAAGVAVVSLAAEVTRRPTEPRRDVPASATIVRQPVRSGQQVYARGGDLVVLAAVSPGAEILADGHIHVYASLRGRALAGVQGNRDARIFCRSLEAELVSIAGNYQLSEQFKDIAPGRPMQVFLRDESLCIEPF
jgi:septum site-determining protein MinC